MTTAKFIIKVFNNTKPDNKLYKNKTIVKIILILTVSKKNVKTISY
jgi:hypothetical protein